MDELLTLISETVDVIFSGKDPQETSVVKKNLYADGSIYEAGEIPFFWLLSGQEDTVGPLTQALGIERSSKIPFSGAYFFEFFSQEDGSDYVSVQMRDETGVVREIELECSASGANERYAMPVGREAACEASAFKSMLETKISEAAAVSCDQDYPTANDGHSYADPDVFVDDLYSEIGITVAAEVAVFLN